MESYLQIESACGPSFHPKAPQSFAFIYNGPGQYQAFRSQSPDANVPLWPEQVTFSSQRCTDCSYLANGDLVFHTDEDGNENWQLGSVQFNSSRNIVTIHTTAPKVKHIIQCHTARFLYFTANWRQSTVFDVYRVPLPLPDVISDTTATLLYANTETAEMPYGELDRLSDCQNEDGRDSIAALTLGISATIDKLVLVDLPDLGVGTPSPYYCAESFIKSERERFDSLELPGDWRWGCVRFLDANTLIVATDYPPSEKEQNESAGQKGDLLQFAVLDITQRDCPRLKYCEFPKDVASWEVSHWSDCNGRIPQTVFCTNEGGYSSLYTALFCADGIVSELTKFNASFPEPGVIGGADIRATRQVFSLSADNETLAFTFSSPRYPSNIYSLNLSHPGPAAQLTKVQTGGLASPTAFAPCRLASFSASDGLAIPYYRYEPRYAIVREPALPCLMMIHGGPEAQSRPSFSYLVQYFLSQRFVVIVPNIRGSTGYGRKYVQADDVLKRLDSTRDIAELAQHLKSEANSSGNEANGIGIDPSLMFIYGGSYGGFAVLSAMTEYPTLWAGGVDLFGIADFETFLEATAPWRRALREVEYGRLNVPEEREFLRRLSPVHRVENISAPLFLFQGDRDERVPLSETLQMHERLLALGKPVTLVRAVDEGHGITKRANVLRVYSQILAFLLGIVHKRAT